MNEDQPDQPEPPESDDPNEPEAISDIPEPDGPTEVPEPGHPHSEQELTGDPPNDDSLHQLEPHHLRAIEAIMSGAGIDGAARAIGKHRTTVSKWRHQHPAFIAELNLRERQRRERHAEQLSLMDELATQNVLERLQSGDAKAADTWFKARGLANLKSPPVGSSDSHEVLNNLVKRRVAAATANPIDLVLDDMDGITEFAIAVTRPVVIAELVAEFGSDQDEGTSSLQPELEPAQQPVPGPVEGDQ